MKKIYIKPLVKKYSYETPHPLCTASDGKTDRDSEIGGKVGDDDDSGDETLAKPNIDVWSDDIDDEEEL